MIKLVIRRFELFEVIKGKKWLKERIELVDVKDRMERIELVDVKDRRERIELVDVKDRMERK